MKAELITETVKYVSVTLTEEEANDLLRMVAALPYKRTEGSAYALYKALERVL